MTSHQPPYYLIWGLRIEVGNTSIRIEWVYDNIPIGEERDVDFVESIEEVIPTIQEEMIRMRDQYGPIRNVDPRTPGGGSQRTMYGTVYWQRMQDLPDDGR